MKFIWLAVKPFFGLFEEIAQLKCIPLSHIGRSHNG